MEDFSINWVDVPGDFRSPSWNPAEFKTLDWRHCVPEWLRLNWGGFDDEFRASIALTANKEIHAYYLGA